MMYFRKYFEGKISSDTATSSILINGTSTRVTAYAYQTKIINEAIKETLLAAGISCGYDETTYTLCIDGLFVQILAVSKSGNCSVYIKGNTSAVTGISASYGINSGYDYKFYVTLMGEPKGALSVLLGSYSNPALLSDVVGVFKITDLRDMSRKFGIVGTYVYIRGGQGEPLEEIDRLTFNPLLSYPSLTKNGTLIPLVESFDGTGFFKADNCCTGLQELDANKFYDIGGEIYFHFRRLFLVKCTTEIS